jgi:hypothetical protein
MKNYLSVGAVFKNEHHCIVEFIEHYLYHGVDHIYLINDFSSDNFRPLIQTYMDKGVVTLFENDIVTNRVNRQCEIYDKFFLPILHETEWIAILDLDEFMYSPNEINIQNIIRKYENCNSIKVEWVNFGSNGRITQPDSIIEGFTMRSEIPNESHYSYKSILRASDIIRFGVHESIIKNPVGVNLSYSNFGPNELLLNHYRLQSKEFFMNVKSTRGDVNNWYDHIGMKRDEDHFTQWDLDSNKVECKALLNQNLEIIEKLKKRKVTVVITTCDRSFLLEKTLDSFIKHNTYPIEEFIIIEDSGKKGVNDFVLSEKYKHQKFNLIYNETNLGQVPSIDVAYSKVKTDYIFHCEEDWEFLKPGFIERSMEILEKDETIFTVWLRPHNHTSGHPINYSQLYDGYYKMSTNYTHYFRGVLHSWCGFTLNPGLRRTSDCMRFHPYNEKVEKDPLLHHVGEYMINKKYADHGYCAAITTETNGYCTHIGEDYHVKRSYE